MILAAAQDVLKDSELLSPGATQAGTAVEPYFSHEACFGKITVKPWEIGSSFAHHLRMKAQGSPHVRTPSGSARSDLRIL